jgi:formamidopyrimidine-DNA glycosylase
MPEIPDPEGYARSSTSASLAGDAAEALIPYPADAAGGLRGALIGNRFGEVLRRGKFLLFALADDNVMVINPMLTGRQYVQPPRRSWRRRA